MASNLNSAQMPISRCRLRLARMVVASMSTPKSARRARQSTTRHRVAVAHQRLRRRHEAGDIGEILRRARDDRVEARVPHRRRLTRDLSSISLAHRPLHPSFATAVASSIFASSTAMPMPGAVGSSIAPSTSCIGRAQSGRPCSRCRRSARAAPRPASRPERRRRAPRPAAAAASCDVGEVADAGLDRAVDVADDAGGAAHRGDLHGAIKPAGLGRVDRDDLGGALLDDLDHVVRVPGELVGHHRRVDGARHFGDALDALDRLLDI